MLQGRKMMELLRFLGAGIGNSLVTLAVYQFFVTVLSPAFAYAIAWAIGILLVAFCYPSFVFRVRATAMSKGVIGAIYLGSFGLGLILTGLLSYLGLHSRLIVFVVLIVTSATNFIAGRIALNRISSGKLDGFGRRI